MSLFDDEADTQALKPKSGANNVANPKSVLPPRPGSSQFDLRDQLRSIVWEKKDAEKKARRSRQLMPNLEFVKAQQVPLLFEALTLGMMVHKPEDPIEFMLECLLKLELEGIAKYTLNMFVPRVCADGTIYHADGSRTLGDGTVILPDGTKILPDGSRVLLNGDVLHPDGSITRSDGTVLMANGDVLNTDGSITRSDGTVLMANGDVLNLDGSITRSDGTLVPPVDKKRDKRRLRSKKLWMLAMKLASQMAKLHNAASDWDRAIAQAEIDQARSEAAVARAMAEAEKANIQRRRSLEIIEVARKKKDEVICELETVKEKEKATKAKMTRIKEIQELEKNGQRPDSASSVSSVDDMSGNTTPITLSRVASATHKKDSDDSHEQAAPPATGAADSGVHDNHGTQDTGGGGELEDIAGAKSEAPALAPADKGRKYPVSMNNN